MVSLVGVSALATTNSGVSYQGRIVRPDGTPLSGHSTQFKLQIRTPDSQNCLMYEEIQAQDLSETSGAFSLTINDGTGSRTDTTGLTLDKIFSNRGSLTFDPATCSVGPGTYAPNPADGRLLVVLFKDETMSTWEPIPAQKINFVPLAFESKQVQGFTADSILRIADGSGNPVTGISPLSNTQYNALLALANGSSTAYTAAGTLGGSALPTMTSGQVLGWNGSAWVSTSATPAAGSVTGTMLANGAVDSSQLSSSLTINTSGTVGAAVTTTRDFKIYAASPSTFAIDMQAPALTASYSLVWPLSAGSNGQVLTTDGTGNLTWGAAGTSSQWTTHGSNISYDGGGNVGIGTTAPLGALDVEGGTTVSGNGSPITLHAQNAANWGANIDLITGTAFYGKGTVSVGEAGSYGGDLFDVRYATAGQNYALFRGNVGGNNPSSNRGLALGWNRSNGDGESNIIYGTGLGGNPALTIGSFNSTYSERMRISSTGNVGIGTTSPTARLQLPAGTATASTAPLKFAGGTLLTTAEDGAMEYDSSSLYYTIGSTRYVIPLNTASGNYSNVSTISNTSGSITMSPMAGNSVVVNSATVSTSSTTGALIVNGGAGIAGALNANGNITSGGSITATTSAYIPQLYGSSAASGAIRIDGTSNATPGNVYLASAGGNVGIGTTSPNLPFIVAPGGTGSGFGVGWNLTNSSGETDLYNFGQLGPGGFRFLNYNVPGSTYPTSGSTVLMDITSAGKVAINGSDPTANLEVNGSTRFVKYAQGAVDITHSNYVSSYLGESSVQLAFGANGSESVRLDNSGRVGIGTTAPSAPLEVNGAIKSSSAIFGTSAGNAQVEVDNDLEIGGPNYEGGVLRASHNGLGYQPSASGPLHPDFTANLGNQWFGDDGGAVLGFYVRSQTGLQEKYGYVGAVATSSADGSPAIVFGNSNSTGYSEAMRIHGANVGIGTTSPTEALDVVGNLHTSGQQYSSQNVVASGSTVDFNGGNTQVLQSVGGSTITLNSMKDGASYLVVVSDSASRTYTFSGCTTSKFSPANAPTTASTYTMYNIVKLTIGGTVTCLISWSTGYQ